MQPSSCWRPCPASPAAWRRCAGTCRRRCRRGPVQPGTRCGPAPGFAVPAAACAAAQRCEPANHNLCLHCSSCSALTRSYGPACIIAASQPATRAAAGQAAARGGGGATGELRAALALADLLAERRAAAAGDRAAPRGSLSVADFRAAVVGAGPSWARYVAGAPSEARPDRVGGVAALPAPPAGAKAPCSPRGSATGGPARGRPAAARRVLCAARGARASSSRARPKRRGRSAPVAAAPGGRPESAHERHCPLASMGPPCGARQRPQRRRRAGPLGCRSRRLTPCPRAAQASRTTPPRSSAA